MFSIKIKEKCCKLRELENKTYKVYHVMEFNDRLVFIIYSDKHKKWMRVDYQETYPVDECIHSNYI